MLDRLLDGGAVVVLVVVVMLGLEIAYQVWRFARQVFWVVLEAYLDHQDRRARR